MRSSSENMEAPELNLLTALPLTLSRCIVLLLPVDQRARCATVCRGWRALLANTSLWTRLDLLGSTAFLPQALQPNLVERLLHNAPQLQTLYLTAVCTDDTALAMARSEQPFGSVQLLGLSVLVEANRPSVEAKILALAAALPAHRSLRELHLAGDRFPNRRRVILTGAAVSGALVDAALAVQLSTLILSDCQLSAAFAVELARLLGGSALTTLTLCRCVGLLHTAASAAVLAAALRANARLTSLSLSQAWACGKLLFFQA